MENPAMEMSPFVFGVYKLAKFALYPMSWLVFLMGWITAIALAAPSPRRLRRIRMLSVTTLFLFLVLGNHFVASTLLGLIEGNASGFESAPSGHFDAIVVLGGGIYAKGTLRPTDQLSYFTMVRTLCGADLYARGLAPKLVMSGGDATVFGNGPREAVEMKHLAVRLGVPADAILVEDHSRTTYENAVETKRLIGPTSIVLATSALHLARAQALFQQQGFTVTPAACGFSARHKPGEFSDLSPMILLPSADALLSTTHAVNELAGYLFYRLAGKL